MKNKFYTPLILFLCGIVASCDSEKEMSTPITIDVVCGMKVDKSEAFTAKYKDTEYYFDSYDCKKVFLMNPVKFIDSKDEPRDVHSASK